MPTATVNGYSYAYLDEGEGPPVVFAHGLLASKEMFRAQIDVLKPSYRCISVDLRGHGESQGTADSFSLEDQAEDLSNLLTDLVGGPANLIGLSQGGMTFMRLALAHPDQVRSLVLLDTSADVENPETLPSYQELAAGLRDGSDSQRHQVIDVVQTILYGTSWRSTADPEQLAHERDVMLGHDREGLFAACQAVFDRGDIREQIAAIGVPTLVIVGEEDAATPPSKAEEIRDAIPSAKLVRIKRAGHHSPIEAPEQVADALEAFLAEYGREDD